MWKFPEIYCCDPLYTLFIVRLQPCIFLVALKCFFNTFLKAHEFLTSDMKEVKTVSL